MAERIADPVCGMAVDPAIAASVDYEGITYLFCSAACAGEFRSDPRKYLFPRTGR